MVRKIARVGNKIVCFAHKILHDDRDDAYLLETPKGFHFTKKSKFYKSGPILDQGTSSACVGFACAQFLKSFPKENDANPFEIYSLAQELDEFAGKEPRYYGTSIRGGMKALFQMGFIKEYLWAKDVYSIRSFVVDRGPIVVGTHWYDRMSKLQNGFARIEGERKGGHAYLISGVSVEQQAFRCINSWGSKWGENGRFWVSFSDMRILLDEGGVACSPIEV
ncbi:MAG: hypothetical protein DWQ49_09600 [Bacteroidetes bacterium]|nr:MAG: hypothetical protein DWQ49_09600 [Bacteroidota bacterium]